MMLGSNFANFINYLYHFLMGRFLGPANYGELVVLLSIINLLGMVVLALNLVVTKFISSENTESGLKKLYKWFLIRFQIIGIVLCVVVIIFSMPIAAFIKVREFYLIILIGLSFIFAFPLSLNRSVLQGLLRFKEVVITLFIENLSKLILGLLLVYLGFSVAGSVWGILGSIFLALILSKVFLRNISLKNVGNYEKSRDIFVYFMPVFLQALTLTLLLTTDILLVKHFFAPFEAGIYSAVSSLGKIIFFACSPISSVMFPIISNRYAKGESVNRYFLMSLGMTIALCSLVIGIYSFFPTLMVSILYGPSYLQAVSLLIPFSIFMFLYTLAYLMVYFFLSIGKTRVVLVTILAATMQILGIIFYHSSLHQVIMVSILTTGLLVLTLFIFYIFLLKSRKKYAI